MRPRVAISTMRLEGDVAIITGGGRGIGRASALRFAQEGAHVAVADIQEDSARGVVREIQESGGIGLAVTADVSDPDSVGDMVDGTVDQLGRVDVLINNAAISSTVEQKPFEDITVDEWNRLIGVNLTGSFLCCQAVAPYMRARRQGRIINVVSAVIRTPGPWRYAHYVTSKAGIVGLTRALATELGEDNITVNAISPGPAGTGSSLGTPLPEQIRALIAAQALHRREVPEDLAGVAVFLASEDGGFITGQVINVDGGLNFN
jgi:3-oxoacyl-[acyl-carrier protein] reductase